MRFIKKSDLQELVTCGAQATAQLTAEVSDYDAKVCEGTAHHFQLYFQLSQSPDVLNYEGMKNIYTVHTQHHCWSTLK